MSQVFREMEGAKKLATRPDLSSVSNHELFERWRQAGTMPSASCEEQKRDDAAVSRRIYDAAFFVTLQRTNGVEWRRLFSAFHFSGDANAFYDSAASERCSLLHQFPRPAAS